MVLFADNKYRYSLQWDAFSEEQIRAGQLMERLGNHKSKVVVPALIEYMERHPEVMLPDGKINIVVQQTQSREQMETMVKSMARAAVEELMAGMKLVPETSDPGQAPAPRSIWMTCSTIWTFSKGFSPSEHPAPMICVDAGCSIIFRI